MGRLRTTVLADEGLGSRLALGKRYAVRFCTESQWLYESCTHVLETASTSRSNVDKSNRKDNSSNEQPQTLSCTQTTLHKITAVVLQTSR